MCDNRYTKTSTMIIVFVLTLLPSTSAYGQIAEQEAIRHAKLMSPSVFDSTLPAGHFADWLAGVVGKNAVVEWELNDCGEQTGDPAVDKQRDLPFCVGVSVPLADQRRLGITILVGTMKKGFVNNPAIYDMVLESNGKFRTIKRLGDLGKAISPPAK